MIGKFHEKNYFIFILNITLFFSFLYFCLAIIKRKKIISSIFNFPEILNEQLEKINFNYHEGETCKYFHKFKPNLKYNEEELNEAIREMNIPTWSRGYVHCSDPESEVTCPQVVLAWRTLKGWSNKMKNTPLEERNFSLVYHYFDGIGNRISIDIVMFLISLMNNRSLILKGEYLKNGDIADDRSNAYFFHPQVLNYNSTIEKLLENAKPYQVKTFKGWWYTNFTDVFHDDEKNYLYISRLVYAPMIYTHHELFSYSYEHFGMHAVYFISNFLVKIPEVHIKMAIAIIDTVPKSVFLFGVHLRLQYSGQFYSHSVESTMNKITPFLSGLLKEKPTIFAFASDSKEMELCFNQRFYPNTIMTTAIRIPDFDHISALLDLSFLMACNECLLSFRSTFSYSIASRMGKRCWFVEKEAPSIFQATNSQAGSISMLMHYFDVNDWQVCRRFILNEENEIAFRYYYKYYMF